MSASIQEKVKLSSVQVSVITVYTPVHTISLPTEVESSFDEISDFL